MQGYYDYDCASIDYDSLIHRLSRIAHSLPLKTILAEMLEHDPEERIGLVSLKEKLQALRTPPQPPITRSKSSKMLKDLLSQSRRSSSKREQSSDRKAREESKREESSRECSQESSVQKPVLKLKEKDEIVQNNNIDQAQFRNLVKNRLKDRNKENPRIESAAAKQDKMEVQPNFTKVHRASVLHEQSGNGPKFESSMGSKQFECSAQSSLSKLVEGSGLRSLLKLEQLDSDVRTSQPESLKHTSRFGSQLAPDPKQPELSSVDKVMATARGIRGGFAQKGMTFNSKEFLISARSVEQSVNDEQPRSQEERLVFSPIRAEEGQESCDVG
jgi:HD-GYP domain-containing protein (c-di-GMP phosphodiesterase class II)